MVKGSTSVPSTIAGGTVGSTESDDPTHTHFKHATAFFELLDQVLAWDLSGDFGSSARGEEDGEVEERRRSDRVLVDRLGAILDEYLPLPPLLDPHLRQIITPIISLLTTHILPSPSPPTATKSTSREDRRPARPDLHRIGQLGRLLNWITKVRGRKAVVAQFPSDLVYLGSLVALLAPSAEVGASVASAFPIGSARTNGLIKGIDGKLCEDVRSCGLQAFVASPEAWELRSVLLLWLGMLLTVPFDLAAFDAVEEDVSDARIATRGGKDLKTSKTAMTILDLARPLLFRPSQEGTLASLLLARLFARRDSAHLLDTFFSWTAEEVLDKGGDHVPDHSVDTVFLTNVLNLLSTLPGLLSSPSTSDSRVMNQIRVVREELIEGQIKGTRNRLEGTGSTRLRKMEVKALGRWWVARLGAAGRTGGEKRIAPRKAKGIHHAGNADASDREQGGFDMPNGFEEALDGLMDSLSDRDTIVRYSAAKYISRIAILLPTSYGRQIASAVISLFGGDAEAAGGSRATADSYERAVDLGGGDEARWHGTCLAVAELARRGLVDGEMMGELLPWLIEALGFDVRRGAHSIGSNVRDAASYVVWSLARASSPEEIGPFAVAIARKLVVTACYDREVSIRRAASAAFQEHVGRMGLFPHGIDVLGKTDFYSVSIRRTAFLVAAPAVACHAIYRTALLDRLHEVVLRHWDPVVRAQGAESLRLIVSGDHSSDLAIAALEREIAHINSSNTQSIHGAILALTELAKLFHGHDSRSGALARILRVLPQIRPTAFTSFGSDVLLEASCNLITASASAESISDGPVLQAVWRVLDLGMKSRVEDVQLAAARSPHFPVSTYIAGIKTGRPSQKQSFSAALGEIDYTDRKELRQRATARLLSNFDHVGQTSGFDIETRKASVSSLAKIARRTIEAGGASLDDAVKSVLNTFCRGMDDYSTDQRGDVGSWVRMAAAAGAADIIEAVSLAPDLHLVLSQTVVISVLHSLLKQVMEKMDNVRSVAGLALERVALSIQRSQVTGPALDFAGGFTRVLPLQWTEPETFYQAMMSLLQNPLARDAMLDGLFLTVGSKNQRTSKAAQRAFLAELLNTPSSSIPEDRPLEFHVARRLADTAGANLLSNRILIPVLQSAHYLTIEGVCARVVSCSFDGRREWMRLIEHAGQGVLRIKNIDRISAALNLIISAIAIEGLRESALTHVPSFLGHPFPRIRSTTAEHLYLTLQEAGLEGDELDEVLLETDWTDKDFSCPLVKTMELLKRL